MIAGFVKGQTLRLSVPLIAADTIDYLTAKFLFQSSDWDGAEKWAHFAKGDEAYDIPLTDDRITEDAHLNLSAGKWMVYLHGNRFADGAVVQRITTEMREIEVAATGTLDGEPFPEIPASETERILARLKELELGGTVEVDPTLSEKGKAADAKAVGDSLVVGIGVESAENGVNLGSRYNLIIRFGNGTTLECALPDSEYRRPLILDAAPNAGTDAYTRQFAFVPDTGSLYVCVNGRKSEIDYVPQFDWRAVAAYRRKDSPPTEDDAESAGGMWVDYTTGAVYICCGYRLVPPNYKYIWKQVGGTTDFPNVLPNPHPLVIRGGGFAEDVRYDGSEEVVLDLDKLGPSAPEVDAPETDAPETNAPLITYGNALELTDDGVLNVKTTDTAEQDNTLPITSSGVYTIVGNIGAILDTI